jgi:TRAP-type C4-dicarboxylate transport system permease large subunit
MVCHLNSIELFCIQEAKMKRKHTLSLAILLMMLPLLSGCWLAAAAGAGAYGGYKMKEKGYTVQNPITKEKGAAKSTDSE